MDDVQVGSKVSIFRRPGIFIIEEVSARYKLSIKVKDVKSLTSFWVHAENIIVIA